jgi:hypothetical protein
MAITNGYATLSTVKAAARITDAVDDALLELAIESSSRLIDGHCQRHFYTSGSAEARFYAADNSYVCTIDDVIGTAITVATSSGIDGIYDETWQASDIQLEPLNKISAGLKFPSNRLVAVGDYLFPVDPYGETAVRVTATYGFDTAIPVDVQQACVLMSLRQFKRYDSPLGVAGFGDMGAVRVSRIDPDIQSMLAPYRRNVVGVA